MNAEQRLAYLAGFFDGEGCVYILRCRRPRGYNYYYLEVSISNSMPEPLYLAQSLFGGTITVFQDARKGHKVVHRLRLRDSIAFSVLRTFFLC
jgi:hypothetical protein